MDLKDQFRYLVGGYFGITYMDEYPQKEFVLKDIENYIRDFIEINPIDNFDIEQDRIVGNKVTRIKFIGFILGFLIKEIGYFCFIILPMLLILIYHIYDFSKNMRQLNKIRIDNIKRFYNDNDVKNKEFNDSIKKIVEEIEVLDELDNNKKEEIEILDF